jgi:hypothetical protein
MDRRGLLRGLFESACRATGGRWAPALAALFLFAFPSGNALAACNPDATTLCLNGGRFQVHTTWTTSQAQSGAGQAVALTADTGYFWFFSANNVEMVVKVVDGRALNSRFWVFAGGLTNVAVVMTVTDTQTGAVKVYQNPQGVAFQPIQDTGAFAGLLAPEEESKVQSPMSKVGEVTGESRPNLGPWALDLGPFAAQAACVPNATTLCLNGGRFQARVAWTTPQGQNGAGQAVSLTSDTGYFWFFSANNVEMVIKVVTGCGLNSRFWVFAGGLTNVNVVITVTDTVTGTLQTYTNAQGAAFQPIQDTNAFSACAPPPESFAGNWTGGWVNNTFGSSGPASAVVTVNTANQTFSATITLGGNVFGVGAPPPQTFTGSYSPGGITFSQTSPVFGNVNATITPDGAITGSGTNIPNPNISRMDFTGTMNPQKITINYTITFSPAAGGGTATGVLTLNHN